MNGPQSILLHDYKAPKLEPLLSAWSIGLFVLNLITVGTVVSAFNLSKKHRIKELKIVQAELKDQITDLNKEWTTLENNLGDLSEQVSQLSVQDDTQLKQYQDRLGQISDKNKTLNSKEIAMDHTTARTVGEIALGTIAFVGHLLVNLCFAFTYGVYLNNSLKNEEIQLEHVNDCLRKQYSAEKNSRFARIDKIVEGLSEFSKEKYDFLTVQTENEEIKKTDQGKAYVDLHQATQQVTDLEKKQTKLEAEVTALRVQKVQAEQKKQEVEKDLARSEQEVGQLQDMKKDYDQLKGQIAQKESEVDQNRTEISDLRNQLYLAQKKGTEVQSLKNELQKIRDADKNRTKIAKLAVELGPLAPKYTPGKEDGEIPGAMDIDENDDQVDQEWKDYAAAYKERYGEDKRTAAEIIEASFDFAFEHLVVMGEKGDKIKLNRSMNTPASPGAFVVYRYMAYDLLKGGKLALNGCHGYTVLVNNDVELLQSQPEKVLQLKDDQTGGYKPVVIVRHKQCDDFTPPVEAVGQNGVDPVSAKWILEQLTPEEEAHLLNLLLGPVIENSNAEYMQTQEFMRGTTERVNLVQTAFELISDMGSSFAKKFMGNVLPKCWNEHVDTLDVKLKPFIKPEDVIPDDKALKIVDWVLDTDVIGDKRAYDQWTYKQHFVDRIKASQARYQSFFKNLENAIMREPGSEGKKYVNLTFEDVAQINYLSHEMIGSKISQQFGDREYDLGGQHCLFSNLLAILVSDTQDLTVDNVHQMRKAMASYLDKLLKAKMDWEKTKKSLPVVPAKDNAKEWEPILKNLPKGTDKIKELAALAYRFEAAIQKTHGCAVPYYQSWLRNEQVQTVMDSITQEWHEVSTSKIRIDDLTPLEIELAAHTFGVRIGVLPMLTESKTLTDQFGRIVPDGIYSDLFGPNTNEMLLIGATLAKGKPGSYYGIFPKLDLKSITGVDYIDQANLNALEAYWKRLDTLRRH